MKKALEVVKICLNLLMGALCFIKIEHDVAVLPNAEGSVGRADYYYSILDKLSGKNLQFLVYIALAVMAASVALSVVAYIAKDNIKIRLTSHVIFVVAAIFFLVLLCYAVLILRICY